VPWPDALAEQEVNDPSAPPCGTASEKVMLLPDTDPDTVPVAFVPVLLSVIESVPENDVPDWFRVHVIKPEPDESVAVPDHDPVTFAGDGDGEVGDDDPEDELPPPLQPSAATAAQIAAAVTTRRNRVRIMVKLGGF
jgi:hypothetical protein